MDSIDSKQHTSNQQGQHFISSTSSLESGRSTTPRDQGISLDLWNAKAKVLDSMILDYSFEPERLEQPLTKFWTPSLKQEILSLAYYAAPLDQVESYIRKAYAKREEHLSNTLIEAAIIAINNGDVTLKDEKGNALKDYRGNISAEGMAEKLIQLHDELYPKDIKCLDKIIPMLPVENGKEKKDREDVNIAAINQIFDAIRLNDQHTNAAIKNFQEWAAHSAPLNRIHLLFVAFDVLFRRGNELSGQWCGKLADRFYFEVIGFGIQRDLSPRIQQLLKKGLKYIIEGSSIAGRELDVGGLSFRGMPGSCAELGIVSYYDDSGWRGGHGKAGCGGSISKLITSIDISIHSLRDGQSITPSCS